METIRYKLGEISKNDGKNGNKTWIIIKNVVYDVTDYLEKGDHPGGNELIEEWAGKDATKAFDQAGHSGDAKALLKKCKIGEVAEEDRNAKTFTKKSGSLETKFSNNLEKSQGKSCMSLITCGLIG